MRTGQHHRSNCRDGKEAQYHQNRSLLRYCPGEKQRLSNRILGVSFTLISRVRHHKASLERLALASSPIDEVV